MYILFAYVNRENTLKLKKILDNKRINSQIVNTPTQAKLGCGISVKVTPQLKYDVMRLASIYRLSNYTLLSVDESRIPKRVTRIN